MEDEVSSKSIAGEDDLLEPGVSTSSLDRETGDGNSDSQLENGTPDKHCEHSDSTVAVCSVNQELTERAECDVEPLQGFNVGSSVERELNAIVPNKHSEQHNSLATVSYVKQELTKPREHDTESPQGSNDQNNMERESNSMVLSKQEQWSDSLGTVAYVNQEVAKPEECGAESPQGSNAGNYVVRESNANNHRHGKYFYYDTPLSEETGVWIPVSVPPMLEGEYKESIGGLCSNGGYFPEGDMGWSQYIGEDKELTMWDVVVEILLVIRGKVGALASGDVHDGCTVSWLSSHLLEQAWKEMAETLTEANSSNLREALEAEPPKWLVDSAASSCMLCSVRFHPIMCSRHHCRFCGGIFCGECSKGRSLLPAKFRISDPQRVCDVCFVRLDSVQPYLMNQVSRAAQVPTHDLTDLSTLRSWVNFPWGQSMEYEIYKATNTIRDYIKVGYLRPEKSIPNVVLRQAKGLAILTVVKVGVMVTYNIGTGLVIAHREDGSWSPPSAISSFGLGWGAQAGGELTDFIIVLRTKDAVKAFSGNMHLSIGAVLSAAVGIIGRTVEADVRAGDGGYGACYTYSCSKGAFVGCSLEGNIVVTRAQENSRFYGSQSTTAYDILNGSLPKPPAAAVLYQALRDLYQKLEIV